MDDISDIKELVVQALNRKKVLSRLRAELRSNVFVTIEEEGASVGDGLSKKTSTTSRENLLKTEQGQLLADLVHEFLQWTNMEFTLRVFEPELSLSTEHRTRAELVRQLELPGALPQGPLLLALLEGLGAKGQPARPSMQQQQQQQQQQPNPALSTRPPPPLSAAEAEPEVSVEEEYSYPEEVESDDELGNAQIEVEDDDEGESPVGTNSSAAGPPGDSATTRGALFGPMGDELASPLRSPYSPDSDGKDEFGKPRTLSPLAPLGSRSPLAPLAPLGGAKGLMPLAGAKRAPNDIKDELRRAGLLTLPTDSFSVSESSLDIPLHGEEPSSAGNRPSPSRLSIQSLPDPVTSRLRLQDLTSSEVGQSLELRDFDIMPSDHPGDLDLDDADYAETAEWS